MRILCFANAKGGCGKTTSVHAIGEALALDGVNVLLIDLDPDGSLTQGVGVSDAAGRSMAEVLGDAKPGKTPLRAIIQEVRPGLFIAPSDYALADTALGLVARMGREQVLKKALAGLDGYDLVMIDCAPSLSLLTVAALTAADAVIIPTQPQGVDLRGVKNFLSTVDQVREINPGLELLGILVTFFGRYNHHKAAIQDIQDAGLPILPAMIGRAIAIAEAPTHAQSIVTFDPRHPQSENYRILANEVKKWLSEN